MTYRLAPHGAADFFERYRTKEEVEQWRERDPLSLLRDSLTDAGTVDDDAVEQIREDARREVAQAVEFADNSPEPPVERLYDDVYAGADEYLGDDGGGTAGD